MQAGSNSTRLPIRLDSFRNVTAQVFSRSALENSQVPTMVRGAAGAGSVTAGSLTCGSVTCGSVTGGTVTEGLGACAQSGAVAAISTIKASDRTRVIPGN